MPNENQKIKDLPLENPQKSDKSLVENSAKSAENYVRKNKKSSKNGDARRGGQKIWILFLVLGILMMGGGAAMIVFSLLPSGEENENGTVAEENATENEHYIYSKLTGLPLADASEVDAPTYCIQTPNGTDGARPQAGLNTAGVVFEAIAEAGITRFAAIYQNPSAAVIGPIRSLRLYYLEWDTPFDCTIVHAGGADDALKAVSSGKYRDLTENYAYMYRGTAADRRWNNLFTTATNLKKFSADRGYNTSEVKGFSRLTPEESLIERVDAGVEDKLVITEEAKGDVATVAPSVTNVAVNFGNIPNYNVRYVYDSERNVYLRSYGSGAAHNVYACPDNDLGEVDPEKTCELTQMAPSVVATMFVSEKRASDNYHEDITVIGSGEAVIFQNGTAIAGKWSKTSDDAQIVFTDKSGEVIKLAPGQTFVEAVPVYGSVEY